ncbi:hypothetical protein LCGC14_2789120, partial [marine sediment metagenome]
LLMSDFILGRFLENAEIARRRKILRVEELGMIAAADAIKWLRKKVKRLEAERVSTGLNHD